MVAIANSGTVRNPVSGGGIARVAGLISSSREEQIPHNPMAIIPF
jgi:hypothetical protein